MTRFLRKLLKGCFTLFFYWSGVMLLICLCCVGRPIFFQPSTLVYIFSCILGFLLFSKWHFNSIYVFGHEATHWLVAKLFLRDTGQMKVSKSGGSVEVTDANVWITLAPYFLPFYVLITVSLLGISQFFWYPTPPLGILAFSIVSGLAYAYHVMLTLFVLNKQQSDLELYGPVFSVGVILAGNMLFLLLVVIMSANAWAEARAFFLNALNMQREWLDQLIHGTRQIIEQWR